MTGSGSHKGQVAWNLVLQYSGISILLIQGVVLIPVYLRFLGGAEFGVWLITNGVTAWISIIDPGISALVQQRMSLALGGGNPGKAVQLARRGLRLNAALAGAVLLVGLLSSHWILRAVDPRRELLPTTGWWLIFLTVAGVAANMVATFTTTMGIAFRQARPHTLVWLGCAIASLVATVAMLWLGVGVIALPLGMLVRSVLQAALSFALLWPSMVALRRDSPVLAADLVGEVDFRLLGWSSLEKFAGTLAMSADMILIGRYFDSTMVTSYALTKRPVDMLATLFQRPIAAMTPTITYLVGSQATDELSVLVARSCVRTLWILGLACVGTALFLEPIINVWVGPAHFLGADGRNILVLGLATGVFAGWFSNLYWASGATLGFYRLNSLVSLLMIIGMGAGLYWHGVLGLMIGVIAPRLLLAAWIFPRLALRALRVAGIWRMAIWRELLTVTAAFGISMLSATYASRALGISVWVQWLIASTIFLAVVGLVSRQLRQDTQALAGKIFAPAV